MDENDVKLRERVTKVESDLANEVKEREKLADIIDDMRDIVSEIRHMRVDLNGISTKVDNLEQKPSKRWDSIVAALISAFVGGIGGMLLTRLIGG